MRLGKYQLGRTLGEGTFGKVKQAVDLETNEPVAIKILDKSLITSQQMTAQIKKEIAVMKLVKQRHVVNLIEVLVSRSKVFIVLELVTGGELFERIANSGRFDEQTARHYFQQLVCGLEYCHQQGVCHRDLKPENLLLDEDALLKISDFGFSALHGSDSSTAILHTQCGTPNYVAPEVLSEQGYDGFKADVWSCGVILFVLLAGFLPFEEPSMSTLFDKILQANFTCPDWFSPAARELLTRVLQPSPAERFTLAQIKTHRWFREGGVPAVIERGAVIDPPLPGVADLGGAAPWRQIEEPNEPGSVVGGTAGGVVGAVIASEGTAGDGSMVGATDGATPMVADQVGEPQRINAFELITLCGGLNLMPMFAGDAASLRRSTRFHSRRPPAEIIRRLTEELSAAGAKCDVVTNQFKLCASLMRPMGQLSCTAQVFAIAPSLYLLDWRCGQGDREAHNKLYQEIRDRASDLLVPIDGENQQTGEA